MYVFMVVRRIKRVVKHKLRSQLQMQQSAFGGREKRNGLCRTENCFKLPCKRANESIVRWVDLRPYSYFCQ